MSERARMFVALDLDEDAGRAVVRWREEASSAFKSLTAGIRPVDMSALHVTLCFLGSRPLEEVDAIAEACAIGSGLPITGLRLGEAKWLPRRHPRVLAATVEDATGALARVQAAIAEALATGGWYRPEKRPFLAHVTVARVAGSQHGAKLPPPPPPPPLELAETATVTLYRSRLSPRGSTYEALRAIRFDREAGSAGASS